jgi:glycosyltransferase involved in cell wall biosynthesis
VYSPGYAAFVSGQRQLLTLHDLIHLETSGVQRAKYAAYYDLVIRPAIRRAGRVLTVSSTSAEALRRWLRTDKIDIINTGNACSAVFTHDGDRIESTEPYVVFVGNMREHKNVGVLVRALRMVPGVRLKMVIPAAEAERALGLASDSRVSERVDLHHGLSDEGLAELYRGAVATVLPATLEGFGLPALESTCCGTPVLYWVGCRAIAEATLGNGIPIEDAVDPGGWAESIAELASSRRRVNASHRPSWDDVADVVTDSVRGW